MSNLNPTPPEAKQIVSPLTRLNLFLICLMILLYGALTLTEFLPSIMAMLAASLIVTYLLLGPVNGLEYFLGKVFPRQWNVSSGLRRMLAIVTVYLLCIGLFIFAAIRIVVPVSIQVKEFAKDLPTHLGKVHGAPNLGTATTNHFKASASRVEKTTANAAGSTQNIRHQQTILSTKALSQNPKARLVSATRSLVMQKLASISKGYATKLGRYVLDVGATTLSSVVYILTTLVLVFYLLHDGQTLRRGMINLMPSRHGAFANQFLTRLHNQFYTIIKGQVLMSFLSGGLMYCVLLIIGVKYALLLGVVLGCVSILPVIGPWLGLLPIIVVVEMSGSPLHILPVLLVAGSFYLLKSYWLWPKLVSKKFEIHPILFILTFLACIQIMGFSGIFLSFPLASILGVWIDFQKARHSKKGPRLLPLEAV